MVSRISPAVSRAKVSRPFGSKAMLTHDPSPACAERSSCALNPGNNVKVAGSVAAFAFNASFQLLYASNAFFASNGFVDPVLSARPCVFTFCHAVSVALGPIPSHALVELIQLESEAIQSTLARSRFSSTRMLTRADAADASRSEER